MTEEFAKITILEHLQELRNRLTNCFIFFILSCIISYYFAEDIYKILISPLNRKMIYTGLTEAFITYLKLSLFTGFLISFPYFAIQMYRFFAPGLYKYEKKLLLPFLVAAPILFFLGASLVYFVVMPLAWEFFLSFENGNIALQAKVSEYLSLVMNLIIGFGISFQMPVIITILTKSGVITVNSLKQNRRFAIVLITIIAAILTPPDVISQLVLATSLYGLYEISIIGAKRVTKYA